MADKSELPTVYIGDKFTIDGTEVAVSNALGIENMGGDVVGVVVKVLSDDVHIDPSAMSHRTRIVAGDDMYPTGRVSAAIDYLKDVYAYTKAQHYEEYGGSLSDRMDNEVLDVIDEVLDRLGVPSVETEEVRPWGTNTVAFLTEVPPSSFTLDRVNRADEVVLHLDGMSFVTGGNEVEWVGADCIDNLLINVTTHVTRVWPIDDPDHLGTPLDEGDMYTVSTVEWDMVYNDGAYVDADRVVTVNNVRLGEGVTDDLMSRAEYEVRVNHESNYTDLVTLLTRDEYTTVFPTKEDEDNDD